MGVLDAPPETDEIPYERRRTRKSADSRQVIPASIANYYKPEIVAARSSQSRRIAV